MSLPEDFDFSVDLPCTIKTGTGKCLRFVGVRGQEDDTQAIFVKVITEEEWLEELGIEDDE
jgi:hypothetical protein